MPRAKKNISKDLMFQRIMPSTDIIDNSPEEENEAATNSPATEIPPQEQASEPVSSQAISTEPIPQPPVATEAVPQQEPLEPQNVVPTPDTTYAQSATPHPHQHRQIQPPSSPVVKNLSSTIGQQPPGAASQLAARTIAFSPGTENYITNMMEKEVSTRLEGVLSRFKCCKCDRCKKDIVALSLNALPPKYKVFEGNVPVGGNTVLTQQEMMEITTAIVRAAIKVKAEPRH